MDRLVVKVRVVHATQAHVRLSVFVGPDVDHLALSGQLVLRDYEWPLFCLLLRRGSGWDGSRRVIVIVDEAGGRDEPSSLERVTDVAIAHVEHTERVPGCELCRVSLAELV